jgi:hypothetical protein
MLDPPLEALHRGIAHGLPLPYQVCQDDSLLDIVEIGYNPPSVIINNNFETVIIARPIVNSDTVLTIPIAHLHNVSVTLEHFAYT